MVGSIQGGSVISRSGRRLARISAIGALVAALGLAGCGRKAGLDPPPNAAVSDPSAPRQADLGPGLGPDGKPVAPASGQRKSFGLLDWLID
jgi:predicted small lipoprotein YifL